MPATQLFRSLAFRVLLNPAPRTQSESNAIFRVLQDYGPIHTFRILDHLPATNLNARPEKAQTGASAILVFTHNTKAVYDLRSDKSKRRFTVVANANITDPSVKDPYNVRGLRTRKPELDAREIECCIIPVEEEEHGSGVAILDALRRNPYNGRFAVDRSSIFAEILDRTDCPSGLIHGLLPKLTDEDRDAASDQGLTRTETTESELNTKRNVPDQREVHVEGLDPIEPHNSQPIGATAAHQENPSVDRNPKDVVTPFDEFAKLKDISLMQMYRDATRAGRSQTDGPATTFMPFSNRSRTK